MLLQLASPKKPKTIHIEWDEGGVEAAGSEVHFFCEGSWAQCRLTAEAQRFASHRDALRALSGELHAIMPTSLAAGGDPIDTEEDVHAQYKWLYCTRPTGNCRRPMMSVEEFEAKERRCGVRHRGGDGRSAPISALLRSVERVRARSIIYGPVERTQGRSI